VSERRGRESDKGGGLVPRPAAFGAQEGRSVGLWGKAGNQQHVTLRNRINSECQSLSLEKYSPSALRTVTGRLTSVSCEWHKICPPDASGAARIWAAFVMDRVLRGFSFLGRKVSASCGRKSASAGAEDTLTAPGVDHIIFFFEPSVLPICLRTRQGIRGSYKRGRPAGVPGEASVTGG